MELALQFAKALQCEDNNTVGKTPTGVACGKCKSCHQTDTGNQPDIRIVTYEKSGIGVDEIREQIKHAIENKPAAHCFEKPGEITEAHQMAQIGG